MTLEHLTNSWKEIQAQEKALNERKRDLSQQTVKELKTLIGEEVDYQLRSLRQNFTSNDVANTYRKMYQYPAEVSPQKALKTIAEVAAAALT